MTVTPHTGDVLSEQAPTASRDGWQQINCTVCGHEATHILSRRFLDLDGTQWYADGVDDIVDRGLMNGTGPVTFEPDSTMTRAMLVTVLWRSAGSPNEGTNGFTDIPADQWYTQAVAWAAQNGIVNGVGNNKFDPDAKITREQLAAVLYRYAGKVGMDVTARADLKLFPDAGSVSAYATDALSWCVANGIVNGYGDSLFGPNDPVTREQLAAILYRYAVYGGMTAVTLEENLGSFADTAQLSAYAIQAMNWAVGQGLINGSGSNLVPKAQATRAQVAAIIHRYLER